MDKTFPSVIGLNVGGKIFTTRLSTLMKYPDSMLCVMFSGRHNLDTDKDGNYFIDRNGAYFEHILDFLRNDQYLPPRALSESVHEEAEYFGIVAFVDKLKKTPPLFPGYGFREEVRKSVVNYDDSKEKIISLAEANVLKNKSNNESNTTVFILYYTIDQYRIAGMSRLDDEWYLNALSFEDVLKIFVGSQYNENTVGINTDDVKDINDFISVLEYDLNKTGYTFKCGKYTGSYGSHGVNFNGVKLRRIDCFVFTFSWSFI